MTSWRMGYSPAGVSTGSFHARYARQLYSSFGWRRVASSRYLTSIDSSSVLTMHSEKTPRTSQNVSRWSPLHLRRWLVPRFMLR
jgi:hypothetical protein